MAPSLSTNGRSAASASFSSLANCPSSSIPPRVHTHARSVEISDLIDAKSNAANMPRNLRIRDACQGTKREQSFGVPKNEGRSKGIRYTVAEQSLQQVGKRRVARRVVKRVADGNGDSPVRAQHAQHLAQGKGAIVEEHQTELADDRVETPVGERQGLGAAFPPFDARALAARHRQHVGVGIKARDGPLRSNPLERGAGKNAGPAGDVQYALAAPDPGRVGDDRTPLPEQRRDKHLVIDFCGCAGSLNDGHVTSSNQQGGRGAALWIDCAGDRSLGHGQLP